MTLESVKSEHPKLTNCGIICCKFCDRLHCLNTRLASAIYSLRYDVIIP